MMIGKNGRIFGKINIIDAGVILLLLIAASFAVYKSGLLSSKQIIAGSSDKIRIVFLEEEVESFTANNVKLNDPVRENSFNAGFGKVVDIKISDSISWGVDKDGKQVLSKKEGYLSIQVTMEAAGTFDANSITIGGNRYSIGQLYTLKIGATIMYGRITGMSKA